ncbi:hypothetical protein ACGGAQ_10455 [Micromonospora sp. NPDC047557]|uniref:hypothetical protein n=1 Tax=Micromonospora sp. NPDC047557 TaxID=3364250 RepID=UPI0037199AA1
MTPANGGIESAVGPPGRRAASALLTATVLLPLGACGTSAQDDARDELNEHIGQVAADATDWAEHETGAGGLPDTRQILDRVVTTVDANARSLGSEVRVPDPDGTGQLGEVRVALEGSGSNWLWSQDEALYVFCARFTVSRQPGRPREVSAKLFDCPPDAVPSGWDPTGPSVPTPTGISS